ncbi:MAG: ABC transporter permease [Acidobacteria bacterium]|nr:ABC transporter permease [Acidobacteriota bacterium]
MTSSSPATFGPLIERRNAAGPLRLRDEIRDLVRQQSLLYELVHRDLTVRYKRSALGFLWTMLHPLLLMLIFTAVFSNLFRFQTPHYETYFLSAYIAWNFFSQTVVNAMASVSWNGHLMKRVRVPLSIFTISTAISGIVNLLLSLIVLFGIMLVLRVPLRPAVLYLPVSLTILFVFTLGVSLALTAISVYFGDVREMVQAGMPALMYLTPVIYPITIVPERYQWVVRSNPLMYIVELVRLPLYYKLVPSVRIAGGGALVAVIALVGGWMIFRHLAPRFHAHL